MPSGAILMTTESRPSVEDLAKHLGVVRDSVFRWSEGRGLPASKVGRLWSSKLSQVDDGVRAGDADAGEDAEVET
jgi:hypothetical protein